MGKAGGNRIAKLVRFSNPWHHSRADRVFGLGFALVVSGAFGLFWTGSATMAMASLVVMSLGFCVMVLCMGVEDLFGKTEFPVKKGEKDRGVDGFESGDAFEDDGGPHRRRKGPKGRM